MANLFCVRPATRNIGNDLINKATTDLLYAVFGPQASIINIPALRGPQYGGLTSQQVYDMNRFADGVVVGGGNLFENGQITIESHALEALSVPTLLIGLSHGRIYDEAYAFTHRTDSLPAHLVRQLGEKAMVRMVRDHASRGLLAELGVGGVEVTGCPSLFLPPNPAGAEGDGNILLSIRHPSRMSVPPPLQWRIADDVRRMIASLRAAYGDVVSLICHDYKDLEFAAAFPGMRALYFDDVERYIATLRACRLNVSYRLHAFLPCLAFGVPTIHLSYDERGQDMVATAGMKEWDIDLGREHDAVEAVMQRARAVDTYHRLRNKALPGIAELRTQTAAGLTRFAEAVTARKSRREGAAS
ncbi:polysaccharide pyruvyl transferase family protein [Methylorubrum sp. SB2]|uniref:polysaccharide pyruvyl transferase family protein n=1 Tax=Methylorubrum subtropicum TaxID=3138812 RepID=UPI00313DEB5D